MLSASAPRSNPLLVLERDLCDPVIFHLPLTPFLKNENIVKNRSSSQSSSLLKNEGRRWTLIALVHLTQCQVLGTLSGLLPTQLNCKGRADDGKTCVIAKLICDSAIGYHLKQRRFYQSLFSEFFIFSSGLKKLDFSKAIAVCK